jgi:arylsulfatase A-like enzyme
VFKCQRTSEAPFQYGSFGNYLDGFNQLPYLTGQQPRGARTEFFYFNDDGDLVAMRYDDWKFVFEEQRQPDQLDVRANPFTTLRLPKMFNLRMDPYEHADISGGDYDVAGNKRLPHRRRSDEIGGIPRDLRRVSAEPDTGQLRYRPDQKECR